MTGDHSLLMLRPDSSRVLHLHRDTDGIRHVPGILHFDRCVGAFEYLVDRVFDGLLLDAHTNWLRLCV